MNYSAQISGSGATLQTITNNFTNSDVLDPTNTTIQKLNILYVEDVSTTNDRSVYATNLIDLVPILYQSQSSSTEYYYNDSDRKANNTSVYQAKKKISEAHIPYIHGELIGAGYIPYARYNTTSTDATESGSNDTVMSTKNAEKVINNLGRILAVDTANNIQLIGYDVTSSGQLQARVLSQFAISSTSITIDGLLSTEYPITLSS